MKVFYVVMVNGHRNGMDTHAAETLADALVLANPDPRDVVHCCVVSASDGGAARLMQGVWHYVSRRKALAVVRGAEFKPLVRMAESIAVNAR